MQQRQLRLGDILDDYCPRERRVTNHAVVAMVASDVKQTRCTACDTEHEYKHAKVPRPRRKSDAPAAVQGQVVASRPTKRTRSEVVDEEAASEPMAAPALPHHPEPPAPEPVQPIAKPASARAAIEKESEPEAPAADNDGQPERDEGPVHRPLIRASLPRPEGQTPSARPIPDFTIRQPGGRPNSRFRPRNQRAAQPFHPGRSNGNPAAPPRGLPRTGSGRPQMTSHLAKRQGQGQGHGQGRKRSK